MAFDLATAKPINKAPRGFDLSSAKPVAGEEPSLPEVEVIAAPDIGEIPGQRVQPKPFDLGDFARGVVETPGVLLTNAFGQLVGAPYGVVKSALEGGYGTKQSVERAQKYAGEAAEALSYTPRTETGRDIISGIGKFVDSSKLSGLNPFTAAELAPLTSPALRQAASAVRNEAELVKPTITKPFQEAAQRKAERKSSESWQNAAQIDAAKNARELGILLNPATSNPTARNKIMGALAGTDTVDVKFARENEPKWTAIAKREMGLGKDEVLNDAAFNKALDSKSKPYDVVRQLPVLAPDQNVVSQLDALYIRTPAIGGEANAATVNTLIDEAKAKIMAGRTGNQVVDDIRQLRRDANVIYKTQSKSGVADPSLIAKADANMGVANALESLIDANAPNPKVLSDLKKARAEMAQIYSYERATDPVTGKVDPIELAKMLGKKEPLSGNAKRMAEIATVYPSVAFVGPETSNVGAKITRSGLGGAAGYVAGAPFGVGPFTGVLGAGIGGVSSGLTAKYMGRPGYQAAYAVPQDFRLPLPKAAPEITPVTNNLPVPYDFRNSLLTKEEIPNWVYGRSDTISAPFEPTAYTRTGPTPVRTPQIEPPSAESTMRTLQQRRAYDYNLEKELKTAAEAKAEAEAVGGRKPTGAGTLFELDPITGKLRPVEPKTTPSSIMPSALESAAQKLSGQVVEDTTSKSFRVRTGKVDEQNAPIYRVVNKKTGSEFRYGENKSFDMTAEERIAWDRTKVELAVVDSSLSKLSDKALAEKMLDRAWVDAEIVKAKEKARAFDEIAKRAKTAQDIRRAEIERDKLVDALESLEVSLGRPRPVSSGQQGPKTREAIRNKLAPKSTNNLRND